MFNFRSAATFFSGLFWLVFLVQPCFFYRQSLIGSIQAIGSRAERPYRYTGFVVTNDVP